MFQWVVKVYSVEMKTYKTKTMTNNPEGKNTDIIIEGQVLDTVESFFNT